MDEKLQTVISEISIPLFIRSNDILYKSKSILVDDLVKTASSFSNASFMLKEKGFSLLAYTFTNDAGDFTISWACYDGLSKKLLGNVANVLSKPMNGIVGFVSLLKDSELSSEQIAWLKEIEHSTYTLVEEIHNMLDFIKSRYYEITLIPANFRMNELVTTVKSDLESRFDPVSVEIIECEIEDEIIFGDLFRIRQLLYTIIIATGALVRLKIWRRDARSLAFTLTPGAPTDEGISQALVAHLCEIMNGEVVATTTTTTIFLPLPKVILQSQPNYHERLCLLICQSDSSRIQYVRWLAEMGILCIPCRRVMEAATLLGVHNIEFILTNFEVDSSTQQFPLPDSKEELTALVRQINPDVIPEYILVVEDSLVITQDIRRLFLLEKYYLPIVTVVTVKEGIQYLKENLGCQMLILDWTLTEIELGLLFANAPQDVFKIFLAPRVRSLPETYDFHLVIPVSTLDGLKRRWDDSIRKRT